MPYVNWANGANQRIVSRSARGDARPPSDHPSPASDFNSLSGPPVEGERPREPLIFAERENKGLSGSTLPHYPFLSKVGIIKTHRTED